MSRRLAPALLVLAILPATAAAQAPDERANARALADIAARTNAEIDAELSGFELPFNEGGTPQQCKSSRRLDRATDRQQERAETLVDGQIIGVFGRAITPFFARAVADMQAVPTADPALRSGRTGWRRVHRLYTAVARLPHVRICIELRDYVRNDFTPTPAMRRAARVQRRFESLSLDDIQRRLDRAVKRMIELGVPADVAAEFAGGGDDEESATQALAPSRPLTAAR
jgi:hypothetical protein